MRAIKSKSLTTRPVIYHTPLWQFDDPSLAHISSTHCSHTMTTLALLSLSGLVSSLSDEVSIEQAVKLREAHSAVI